MFIAVNQFQVQPGREREFEAVWRSRKSFLRDVPGFVRFALLRGDEPGEYLSHSTWESREAFLGWAHSDAFRGAHASRMAEGVLAGHPRARFYEAVLAEEPARLA